MEIQNVIFFFSSCFLLLLLSGVQGSDGINGFHPKKLFVFGDSYVDTGNSNKSAVSWQPPYGITYPGQPAGRYSDGRLLTDFLAKYLGLNSPIPYETWLEKQEGESYGMNFAFGGTGVFDTYVTDPNMTTQIDFFHNLVKTSVYTESDLESALSLVSVAGNDYITFIADNRTDFQAFIASVVNQTAANLKRIHDMGVKKVAVGALHPVGCLPVFTKQTSFQNCNQTMNNLVNIHNTLLQRAVEELNSESKDSGAFIVLDLYGAFTTILGSKGPNATDEFTDVLKPCCMGTKTGYSCGSVDEKGEKMYTVCDNPKTSFFWDGIHPTQAGWRAVFGVLKPEF